MFDDFDTKVQCEEVYREEEVNTFEQLCELERLDLATQHDLQVRAAELRLMMELL